MDIPESDYRRLAATITSDDSPVGIDAKKTHVLILHHLEQIAQRLSALEARLAPVEEGTGAGSNTTTDSLP